MNLFSDFNKKRQSTFIANFLDPMQGLDFNEMMEGVEGKGLWYKEEIVPRNEEEYRKKKKKIDKITKELYFIKVYKNGVAETFCCDKSTFDNIYNRILDC